MAIPNSKSTFKDYCLRALGFGAIDINVTDAQVDDRIDEAVQYFAHYHYDSVEKVYLKHQMTQAEIDRATTNETTTATDSASSSITADWLEGKGFIPVPSSVLSVVQVFPFDYSSTNGLFDIRYQIRLNDIYDFTSSSILHYQMVMDQIDLLSHILVGEIPIRHYEHQNRLYLDMDWNEDVTAGDYIVIECYRKLDPATNTDVFNDMHLKRYATALIKKQWGANLSKFQGVQMLGGVEMNGGEIYSQAQEEITNIEDQIQNMQYPATLHKG